MATTIVTKSGSGAPAASDLVAGELAVDLTNGRLYTEDSGGTVLELGLNPSGNVGIGTSSPSTSLDVVRAGTQPLRLQSTSGTEVAINMVNTGGNVQLEAHSGNFNIDADAVGIGVTPKAWSVYNAIQIGEGALAGGEATAYGTSLSSNAYFDGSWKYLTTDEASEYKMSNGVHAFRIAASGSADSAISWTTAMTIDNSGNVGIGDNTFAAGKLRVYDSSGNHVWLKGRASDGTSSVSFRNNADNTYNGRIQVADTGGMLFQVAGSTRATIDASGNLLVGKTANNITDTGAVIRSTGETFLTRSGNPLSLNRLSSDGNVLEIRKDSAVVGAIACRSSGGNLQIHTDESGIDFAGSGYLPMRGSTITDNNLDIGSSTFRYKDLYLSNAAKIGANASEYANNYIRFKSTGAAYIDHNTVGQSINFRLSNASSLDKTVMTLTSAGNLLVGGTSVGASDSCSIESYGDITISRSSGVGRTNMTFINGGTTVGSIYTSTSATTYATSSDQRLKSSIADADDAGSKIDAIQVRKFDWKSDGSHQDYGMVAQELLEVAPEAVSAPEDPEEMMGVDYSKLVPMMLKEIQSLRARIAALES